VGAKAEHSLHLLSWVVFYVGPLKGRQGEEGDALGLEGTVALAPGARSRLGAALGAFFLGFFAGGVLQNHRAEGVLEKLTEGEEGIEGFCLVGEVERLGEKGMLEGAEGVKKEIGGMFVVLGFGVLNPEEKDEAEALDGPADRAGGEGASGGKRTPRQSDAPGEDVEANEGGEGELFVGAEKGEQDLARDPGEAGGFVRGEDRGRKELGGVHRGKIKA